MTWPELLIRGTAWLALLGWVAGEVLAAPRLRRTLQWIWTLGALAMLAHAVAAMHFRHDWSHAQAVAATASDTESLVGLNWGGGLWFNYAFTAVWLADAFGAWQHPAAWRGPSRWRTVRRAFFLFMWVNGAVVFVGSPLRWFGAAAVAAVLFAWWKHRAPGCQGDSHPRTA